MEDKRSRRNFLGTVGSVAAATVALRPLTGSASATQNTPGSAATAGKATPFRKVALEPFDYAGVTLRPSLWQRQSAAGRDFYLGLSNDDILHGYRVASGTATACISIPGTAACSGDRLIWDIQHSVIGCPESSRIVCQSISWPPLISMVSPAM